MKEAVVTANIISVRADRGLEYEKIGEYVKGDRIIVLDEKLDETYAKVLWQVGYAFSDSGKYIEFTEPEIPLVPNSIVTANRISVRTGRGVDYDKLGEYKNGDKIIVLDDTLSYEYSHVVWKDSEGYAYCDYGKYIRFLNINIPDAIKKTLDIISTCVGGQYIYGGQGHKITEQYVKERKKAHPEYFTNGRYEYLLAIGKSCDETGVWEHPHDYAWDCSGLWWDSTNKSGIYGGYKDTTAHTFYTNYCTPINKADLIAGDGVFYKNSAGRVSHMGIVGEGGRVYEAMSGYTGVVLLDNVDIRSADRVVGSGTYTRNAWNLFGRPKIFE